MFPLSIDSPFFIPGLCLLMAGTVTLAMTSSALAPLGHFPFRS